MLWVAALAPFGLWRWGVMRRQADRLQDYLEQIVSAVRYGLPVHEVLDALAEEAPSKRRRLELQATASVAKQSGSLAEAVDARPRWCPPELRDLVRAGETQRALGPALDLAREELSEGPYLQAENLQRVGYPAMLIATVLWLSLFIDEVIATKFQEMGKVYERTLWPEQASQPVSVLLWVLAAVITVWVAVLLSHRVRLLLIALAGYVPGLRGWAEARRNARWLGRAGALLGSDQALAPALQQAAQLGGGRRVAEAATRAAEGAPLAEVLGQALGPAGSRDLPRLLLLVRSHGPGLGLRLAAARLRRESRRRLGRVGDAVQPLPTLLCGAAAAGMAWGVFHAIGAVQQHVFEQIPGGVW